MAYSRLAHWAISRARWSPVISRLRRGHLGHLDELFPGRIEIQLQQLDCLRGSWLSHSLLSNDQTGCDAVPVRVGHNKMARSFHAFCLEQFYRRRNRDFSAPKKNMRFLEARPATEMLMGVALGLQEPIGVGINSMHRACF